MRAIKKWLFPVLTCLIALGAAVLPPYLSDVRDARQFGQVHTEELSADPLPVYEPPGLLDRMEMYARQNSSDHPVLFFRDPFYFESNPSEMAELTQSVQDMLTEAEILPRGIFEEEPFDGLEALRLLLLDPEQDQNGAVQFPSTFWQITWAYRSDKRHQKSVRVLVDGETGLPIDLYVHDTNMSQWLPYNVDHLWALSKRFFELLELDAKQVDIGGPLYGDPSLNLSYSIDGGSMYYFFSRAPTDLFIQLDINWQRQGDDGRTVYDG